MDGQNVGWEYEMIKKSDPTRIFRWFSIFVFLWLEGLSLLEIVSHFSKWDVSIMPIYLAVIIFLICNPVTYVRILRKRFRLMTTVGIYQNGIRYWTQKVTPWNKIGAVHFEWQKGLPYFVINNQSGLNTDIHVPLYLQRLDSFIEKLKECTPKGHVLEHIIPEIERLKADENGKLIEPG